MNQTTIPKYWRSLDELDNSPEFQEFVHREFPVAASEFPAGVSRRRWMQLMGASFALAGVAGCRWETEKIAPLVNRPEGYIPGKTQKYATTIELAGAPRHLLVTCYDNRPVKIEGNPDHPGSLGATDVFSQSATLTLYDPDRSGTCRLRKPEDRKRANAKPQAQGWDDFDEYLSELLDGVRENDGAGFAVLAEPSSSLSQAAAAKRLTDAMPNAKLYEYAPINRSNEIAGADLAFGQKLRTHYKLAEAKVIAAFDADLLCSHPNSTRYARDWAATREIDPESAGHATMGRLYAVESQFSTTGAAADHRAAVKSTDIGWALAEVRDQLKQRLAGEQLAAPEAIANRAELKAKAESEAENESDDKAAEHDGDDHKAPAVTVDQVLWVLADDLASNAGESVVVVGPRQPAEVHALAHEINGMLDNLGKTVVFTDLPESDPPRGSIEELTAAIESGDVTSLAIVGGNPVYDAPANLKFKEKLESLADTMRLGYYEDETSHACQWHLPMCHPLETWGDAVSYEGVPSVAQPLLNPIYETRSPLELLSQLAAENSDGVGEPQQLVRDAFASVLAEAPSDAAWKQLLHDGFIDSSVFNVANPSLVAGLSLEFGERSDSSVEEVVFCPSASVYDGSFANNGWLQELPNFITKVTWDNVAIVSPWTADKLRVKQNELMEVEVNGEKIELPTYVLPGQANGSIGVQLGYGRTAAGAVGGADEGLRILRFRRYWLGEDEVIVVGKNLYPLRTSDNMHVADVTAKPTGRNYDLATTQDHFAIDLAGLQLTKKRIHELVREAPLEEYNKHPNFAKHVVHEVETDPLFPDRTWRDRPNAWGMAIDLNKCTGCNGCVVACQAENNVPVVGKEQVLAGREMHWIRIDRYFHGMPDDFNNEDPASPAVASQMVTCQQCESAPCEQVCPVAATVHSDEGLNDMVYNRCVGTRYCANNCPYKVRRFNYFHMTGYMERPENDLVQLANNPEVTVRSRGVMEKCTFCTQRISAARIDAKVSDRPIADGDVQTACQQACPTEAIAFGDLNDSESRVSRAHADPRAYGMLAELDVRPRNMYLAKISNPHPALAPLVEKKHGHGGHGDRDDHEGGEDHNHGDKDDHDHASEGGEETAKRDDFTLPIIG